LPEQLEADMVCVQAVDPAGLDRILEQAGAFPGPGGAAGIVHQGRVVYRQAVGVGSIEQPAPLGPGTRLRLASLSKHMLAFALVKSCEAGLASLDQPLRRTVPDLHPRVGKVTLRQLLNHTSGIRDVHDVRYHLGGTVCPAYAAELLEVYRHDHGIEAEPGAAWRYNNGAYLLLSLALEAIHRRPLEAVLETLVFAPAGMRGSALHRWDHELLPQCATLHSADGAGAFRRLSPNKEHLGEGGIVASLDDMLTWLGQLLKPGTEFNRLFERLAERTCLNDGRLVDYGLGIATRTYEGVAVHYHAGTTLGGNAMMIAAPELGLGLIVLCNRSDASSSAIAQQMLDRMIDAPAPPAAQHSKPGPALSSVHRSASTGRVAEVRTGGGQPTLILDGEELPVVWDDARGLWVQANGWSPRQIAIDSPGLEGGPVAPVRICELGRWEVFAPVSPPSGDPPPSGRYRSADLHTVITFSITKEGPEASVSGRFGRIRYRLTAAGDRLWRFSAANGEPWRGMLVLDDALDQLVLTTPRTRALTFQRIH
jgi:CubicO group peptidase (beta-lactamase class C family)